MGALVVLVWVACAALGYVVGKPKGRSTAGLLLGLLLGVVGLIIIACLGPKQPAAAHGAGRYGSAGFGGPQYAPPGAPPQWCADPLGRHEQRFWNGMAWTEYVIDQGAHSVDPLTPQATPTPGYQSWSA